MELGTMELGTLTGAANAYVGFEVGVLGRFGLPSCVVILLSAHIPHAFCP